MALQAGSRSRRPDVDKLVDYATGAWYAFVSNLPEPEVEPFGALMQECTALRAKLLMWAEPLVANGSFDAAAIAKIKEGSGNKDVPSDVVALVGLYRSKWDAVENQCAVTEADLDRGAQIAPFVFAMVSQREQRRSRTATKASLRVRAAWTLVDRAYDQCRRGLAYLLWNVDDVDRIAPSLRRNPSLRPRTASAALAPQAAPPAPEPAEGNPPPGPGLTTQSRAEAE